jgi:Domain of unknown function (DUF4375)
MTGERVYQLVREWEDEVNNGGLHQFFYNSSGDDTAETIQALEMIGADKMADILIRAVARLRDGVAPQERFARQRVLPEPSALMDLDMEFYAYPDDLASLLAEYKGRVGK